MKVKPKNCKVCEKEFIPKRLTTERFCSFECSIIDCNKDKKPIQKYQIPKISKKRQVDQLQYSVLRTEFLSKKENQICPITNQKTTDIHHKKGRVGSLFLDTRYWLAVSREGHKMIEENPEWAKENGYSLSRLSNDEN